MFALSAHGLGLLVLAAFVGVACGSSGSHPSPEDQGEASADAPAAGDDDDGGAAAACNDFMAALFACSNVSRAVQAHDTSRFLQACEAELSLPGSTNTVSAFEACAKARSTNCFAACNLAPAGTLPVGATCNTNFVSQCQSGACGETREPDGGYASCGTCPTAALVGQPCSMDGTLNCPQGSFCDGTTSPAVCVAYGAAGSACSPSAICDPGSLFCSSSSQTCTPLGAVGAACSAYTDCIVGLTCQAGACALPGKAGAACNPSTSNVPANEQVFCAPGLTCDTTTSTCASTVYGQPGDACGTGALACLVGECSSKGTCPTVIADGDPCPTDDTQTCDDFADCIGAVCEIPGTTVCR